jgi:uncharacterized protein (TIGR02145 family)
MKELFFLLAIFCALQANAQPYTISFSGIGLSTVKVQNLITGVIVNVPAGDVLRLSTPTSVPDINNIKSSGLMVYPNPMTDNSTLEILPPLPGYAIISVCDMTGKVLTQFKGYVENNIQKFRLSGIKNGLYIVNVRGNGYQLSEKLLSNGKSNGTAIITRISNNIQAVAEKKIKDSKGVQGNVDMAYNNGERLKYTAIAGNNSTVMTNIPTADNTVTFTFTECKDGDNNFYPVVDIGGQLWMAENLKTTKYKDGTTTIPNVTDATAWGAATPAYCWYDNNSANKDNYGALYNWYTVITGNLCPTGWHIPTNDEWHQLVLFLDPGAIMTEISTSLFLESLIAGGKLKEAGTTHWISPNTGATNEMGYTALPGGYRFSNGTFSLIGGYGCWWSSMEYNTSNAWDRFIDYNTIKFYKSHDDKRDGLSVRCLKD